MGICSSTPEASHDKELTIELNKDKAKDLSIKKLLFLGAGGSGKSTIFKQLRKIHGQGWSKDYKRSFVRHIEAQIILEMKLAIDCVAMLAEEELIEKHGEFSKIPDSFDRFARLSSDSQAAVHALETVDLIGDSTLNKTIATYIKTLWKEAIIKEIYNNRATMKIEDSSAYFWNKIDDIISLDYVPTEKDILLLRHRTTGITEQIFSINNNTFHIFDVGGQKSERKKWIHCFEDATAVIFIASLSCYDEIMFEDEEVNSMVDTIQLFEKICNNQWFEKTSMILFLNKKDLFAEKLAENKAITLCPSFIDYDGDVASFEESADYIKECFVEQNKSMDEDKKVFTHLTCATDQNNVENVFGDVQRLIMERSLQSAGVMGDEDFM